MKCYIAATYEVLHMKCATYEVLHYIAATYEVLCADVLVNVVHGVHNIAVSKG